MFNMFTLLLVDALKPATQLIAPFLSSVAGLSASSSSKADTYFIPIGATCRPCGAKNLKTGL